MNEVTIKKANINNISEIINLNSKLFAEFKNICKENNINEIVVTVSYKNKKGIDFYKKNGFSEKDITLSQII